MEQTKIKKGLGVPRGIGISSLLSEIYMRDLDDCIKKRPEVIFYARYVDDIFILLSQLPQGKNISTIEDYYNKCKIRSIEEAKEYVRCFRERNGRNPCASELFEEFIFFVDKRNFSQYPESVLCRQLGALYNLWLENHKAQFASLDDFLAAID